MTSGMQKMGEAQELKVQHTHLFHIAIIHDTWSQIVNVECCEGGHGRTGGLL